MHPQDHSSPASPSEQYRLEYLDALVLALDRADEVTAIILGAEDEGEVVRGVQQLLGVTAAGARAVFDMSWGRMNRGGQRRIRDERAAILRHIQRANDS